MAERNQSADGESKYGNSFRATRYRPPPAGIGQPEDGRDQRARVTDADPEDEVGDIEGPEDGRVEPPAANAGIQLITEGARARHDQAARHRYGEPVGSAGVKQRPQ